MRRADSHLGRMVNVAEEVVDAAAQALQLGPVAHDAAESSSHSDGVAEQLLHFEGVEHLVEHGAKAHFRVCRQEGLPINRYLV